MSVLLFQPLYKKTISMLAVLACITSCMGGNQLEIKDWMDTERSRSVASVPVLAPPVPFVAVPYTLMANVDPFDDLKLKAALVKARASSGDNVLQPNLSRKREALEAFPIDAIKMIGFVLKKGAPTALVSASGTLYTVALGAYIGQDFGKIVAISEQEISFKEIVQDGAGSWTERTTKLPLTLATKEIKK